MLPLLLVLVLLQSSPKPRRIAPGLHFLVRAGYRADMPWSPKNLPWLRQMWADAQRVCPEYGVPPQACLAQACFESDWGNKAPHWNAWGLRAAKGQPSQPFTTTEVIGGKRVVQKDQPFRRFDSAEQAIRAYCERVSTGPYAGATKYRDDLPRWVAYVWSSGYATGTQYVPCIVGIVDDIARKLGIAEAGPWDPSAPASLLAACGRINTAAKSGLAAKRRARDEEFSK